MILNFDRADNTTNDTMSNDTDDIQMQPLDLSCPRRSCYDDGLAMTPPHVGATVLGELDRPHSAESDSDSERPRNLTKSTLRMSSGSENEGPARKRFLTKYLYKDTSGRLLTLLSLSCGLYHKCLRS